MSQTQFDHTVIVTALNDAAFDVMSWPISSVFTKLRGKLTEEIEMSNVIDTDYIQKVRAHIDAVRNEEHTRDGYSRILRAYAAIVFEGMQP